jgi:hypothetical protein
MKSNKQVWFLLAFFVFATHQSARAVSDRCMDALRRTSCFPGCSGESSEWIRFLACERKLGGIAKPNEHKSTEAPASQDDSSFTFYDNYDVTGGQLEAIDLDSADLQYCASVCRRRDSCEAIVFNKRTFQCVLKSTIGSLRFEAGAILGAALSGSSLPPVSDLPWGIEQLPKQSLDSSASRTLSTSSFEQCAKTCENDGECVGISYVSKQQACRLFSAVLGFTFDQDTDSGIKHQVIAGSVVFPSAIDPKYVNEGPWMRTLHTCVDQYNANKDTNANGGLKWIQKGGGYFSECDKHLNGGT